MVNPLTLLTTDQQGNNYLYLFSSADEFNQTSVTRCNVNDTTFSHCTYQAVKHYLMWALTKTINNNTYVYLLVNDEQKDSYDLTVCTIDPATGNFTHCTSTPGSPDITPVGLRTQMTMT